MDGVKSLEALGRHLAEEQDAWLSRSGLEGIRDALPPPRRRRRPRRWPMAVALAALAAGVVVAALVALRPSPPINFTVDDRVGEVNAWVSAPAGASLALRFSDGSRVELDSFARARVAALSHRGAHVVVESGSARISVEKRESTEWVVSSGPFRVQVVGTRFDVAWSPERDLFVLTLHEGRVLVVGCVFGTEGRPVLAGETLRAWCEGKRFEVAQASGHAEPVARAEGAVGEAPMVPSARVGASARVPLPHTPGEGSSEASEAAPPGWRDLLREGNHQAAFAAAEREGFEAACQSANVDELAALADAARFAGRLDRAVAAYQLLRTRFAGSTRAATAAFNLGRIASDSRASHGQAAQWFQIYLAERPSGALAREALGRLMESLHRSGNTAGATEVAVRYLRAYPEGPHARLARQLAAPGADATKRTRKRR